jgi:hypothetical protein
MMLWSYAFPPAGPPSTIISLCPFDSNWPATAVPLHLPVSPSWVRLTCVCVGQCPSCVLCVCVLVLVVESRSRTGVGVVKGWLAAVVLGVPSSPTGVTIVGSDCCGVTGAVGAAVDAVGALKVRNCVVPTSVTYLRWQAGTSAEGRYIKSQRPETGSNPRGSAPTYLSWLGEGSGWWGCLRRNSSNQGNSTRPGLADGEVSQFRFTV